MAKEDAVQDVVQEVGDLEWETVAEESGAPLDLSEVGMMFIGEYAGRELIDPTGNPDDSFFQHKFRASDGMLYVVNGGYKLNVGLESIENGSLVRITRALDIPMSDPGKNPMKDYRIEVAK